MIRMLRLAIVPLLLLLTGCATAEMPVYPDITFSHRPVIPLAVSKVQVVEKYIPPLREPYVEQEFPVSPMQIARNWARDRLKPVGGTALARFIIEEASVRETKLPKKKGLGALFTTQQERRYDALLIVRLEIEDLNGRGFTRVRVERSNTLAEDASLKDRDDLFYRMAEAMARDLDAQLEAGIGKHLKLWRR